jgi:hypothetical protein
MVCGYAHGRMIQLVAATSSQAPRPPRATVFRRHDADLREHERRFHLADEWRPASRQKRDRPSDNTERAVAAGTSDTRSNKSADEISQSIQESEECVWGAVAAGFAVQWRGAGECAFFEREVGVEVHLRGFDLFVSEPERDHGGVDPGVQ